VVNAHGYIARGYGFAPKSVDISAIYFLESIPSSAQDLKWLCDFAEITVTFDVSGDNWQTITVLPRYNNIINI